MADSVGETDGRAVKASEMDTPDGSGDSLWTCWKAIYGVDTTWS